jgi:hypothetical protein
MNMVLDKPKMVRKEIIGYLKFVSDISNRFFHSYILNEFEEENLNNDPGASFTSIKRVGRTIIKKANPEGEKKLADEIQWYLMFKDSPLKKYLPKIYDYSLKKGNVYMIMKYYSYPSLRKIILDNMNARFFLNWRWKHIFYLLDKYFFIEENSAGTPEDFVKKFHYDKLDLRIKQSIKIFPDFSSLIALPMIKINNKDYFNINQILPLIKKNDSLNQRLKPPKIYYSHGDLHPNNILCGVSSKKMILIDCRGKNFYGDLYFDPAYDLAKIFHDLRSKYSLIERHNFSLFINSDKKNLEITYEFNDLKALANLEDSYIMIKHYTDEFAKKHKDVIYRADFTESLLFLTMLPMHSKSFSEFIMCYITGIIRLNEWLFKYHPDLYNELVTQNIKK